MSPVPHSVPDRKLRVVTTVHGRRVTIGQHGIDRYWQRVKPAAASAAIAAADLERVIAGCGEIRADPPAWKHQVHQASGYDRPAVAWLWLGDDVALPLTACLYGAGEFFVPTCLMNGGCGDTVRVVRAERRRAESRLRAQRRAAARGSAIARMQTAGHRARRLRRSIDPIDHEDAA